MIRQITFSTLKETATPLESSTPIQLEVCENFEQGRTFSKNNDFDIMEPNMQKSGESKCDGNQRKHPSRDGRSYSCLQCQSPSAAICGPALFQCASPLDGRDSAFCFLLLFENHLKNGLESPLIFIFILKGKNKIRKKNPKCDS